ncbi:MULTISPECIES: acetaldehyde dehydrogenase (acetylating) [Pandoraea]|uniref:acetaldehyde dehydrogenase (acetylating) n=1 Tax=Pandoraea TaxID=93217 RepID=UPI0003C73C6D|nr:MULTISPECIES: acetaldehyde dehydrogenase (acetylating) [Pandoraea]AHB04883.1 acetaldehyde dehydrogenase [Pandoraea pnomenusa 3kgm]ALU64288.1 acetaldehyde dehydrogenase (acetylating) [Pandoraea pnomenusa]APD11691.1 acetaldehyde dehydrogenase (acetylating) [Pandoraea pnomenusa]
MTTLSKRIPVAILGSGNIGTDLMYKIRNNPLFDLRLVAGIDAASEGLARARELGYRTSTDGVEAVLEAGDIRIVFEATSARAHKLNAPRFKEAGIFAIDLTPAKVGPSVVPCVNMNDSFEAMNVNLISCAAQATIPMVHGVSRVANVKYAEIVATVASKSIGPGTRENIEEFTLTTQKALAEVGGAGRGKAMVVINPADPPLIMRNTIYTIVDDDVDEQAVKDSVLDMVEQVQRYVPGYRLVVEPFRRGDHFMIGVEVEGAGDFLPTYAGNLDIINAAAVAVAERYGATLN